MGRHFFTGNLDLCMEPYKEENGLCPVTHVASASFLSHILLHICGHQRSFALFALEFLAMHSHCCVAESSQEDSEAVGMSLQDVTHVSHCAGGCGCSCTQHRLHACRLPELRAGSSGLKLPLLGTRGWRWGRGIGGAAVFVLVPPLPPSHVLWPFRCGIEP